MARAVASFNDSVINCPLIFADETGGDLALYDPAGEVLFSKP